MRVLKDKRLKTSPSKVWFCISGVVLVWLHSSETCIQWKIKVFLCKLLAENLNHILSSPNSTQKHTFLIVTSRELEEEEVQCGAGVERCQWGCWWMTWEHKIAVYTWRPWPHNKYLKPSVVWTAFNNYSSQISSDALYLQPHVLKI